jgi:hypothetical protein
MSSSRRLCIVTVEVFDVVEYASQAALLWDDYEFGPWQFAAASSTSRGGSTAWFHHWCAIRVTSLDIHGPTFIGCNLATTDFAASLLNA